LLRLSLSSCLGVADSQQQQHEELQQQQQQQQLQLSHGN